MFKLQLYIFLTIYVHNSSCVVNSLYEIGKNLRELYMMVNQIDWEKEHNATDVYNLFTHHNLMVSSIKSHMVIIDRELNAIEELLNPKILSDSLRLLSSDIILNRNIDTIERNVQIINDNYTEFYKHMDPHLSHTVAELGELTWNYVIRVEETIEIIRNIIIDEHKSPNNQPVLSGITMEAMKQYEVMCDNTKTISSTLVQLFQMVMIAEIKANAMLLNANTFRYSHNAGWKMINTVFRKTFEKKFGIYTLKFEKYLSVTDSMYLRRCDPPNGWLQGVNFAELEGTFTESIFYYDQNTCSSYTCNDIRFRYSEYCQVEEYTRRTGCSGTSARCFWLDSIDACIMDQGRRIYEYVNSSVGFYGKHSECPEQWPYYPITELNTKYATCACDCYKSHKISIGLVESDWHHYKVITGLRFVRQDEILHIQVREAHLTSNGFLDEDSVSEDGWKPVPSLPVYETVDINARTFFLDDLLLPGDYVLTGVNFFKTTREHVTGFAIKIHGKFFDFGVLQVNALPTSVTATTSTAGQGLSFKRISSDQTKLPHKVNSKNIAYVTLERSDLTNDFGQTTLPFFDTLPVITAPLSPLTGVGLFHKGVDGFAGFFSFRLYPTAYHKYFKDFNSQRVKNGTVLFNLPHDD